MYKFYEFFTPVLESMKDGSVFSRTEVTEKVAVLLNLSDSEKAELIKTGRPVYADRTQWAMTYLKQAGAISNERRGEWKITQRGLDLLGSKKKVTPKTLKQFPEYIDFIERVGTRKKKADAQSAKLEDYTPTELIDEGISRLEDDVLQRLSELLKTIDPYRFEHICKDLLIAMGYGGEEISYVTQKSGDRGIDAVIRQDPLGISTIYIQAKRYAGEVREKDIRDFLGALAQKATQNGVFITTGIFADEALRAIQTANNMNIVPIDGEKLARLMIQYQIGVEEKSRYITHNINLEYFDYE